MLYEMEGTELKFDASLQSCKTYKCNDYYGHQELRVDNQWSLSALVQLLVQSPFATKVHRVLDRSIHLGILRCYEKLFSE